MDRDFVVSQFTRYVHGFDQREEGVRLKYAHSLRVSSLCEQIAGSLGLSQDEADLAWLIGVLHDIGRFEQLREYHTFVDYRSMDHAKYGAHYLFDDGHIRDFLDDGRLDDVIRMAIDQHNVYQLREDLTPRQRLFCQLIRDADKIDIFRVYVLYMSQKKNIWNVDWADFENQPISDSVMAQAARGSWCGRRIRRLSWIFMSVLCVCTSIWSIPGAVSWHGNKAILISSSISTPEMSIVRKNWMKSAA